LRPSPRRGELEGEVGRLDAKEGHLAHAAVVHLHLLAQEDLGDVLDHVDTERLGHKGQRARSAQVALDDLDLPALGVKVLDVDRASDLRDRG
jgi:hypothetical protein